MKNHEGMPLGMVGATPITMAKNSIKTIPYNKTTKYTSTSSQHNLLPNDLFMIGQRTGTLIPKCKYCGIPVTNSNLGGSDNENGSTITGNVPCIQCSDPESPPGYHDFKKEVKL